MRAAHSRLLDLIEEAVFEPGRWTEAVAAFGDLFGAGGASILSLTEGAGYWSRVDPDARAIFQAQFGTNPIQSGIDRIRRARGPVEVVTDRQLMPRDAFTRTSFYNEFMAPFGAASMMVLDISGPAGTAALNLSRSQAGGEFMPRDIRAAGALQPHLKRAFWLGAKLATRGRREAGIVDFFERSAQAVFLLSQDGHVRHANAAAAALLREVGGLTVTKSRLCGPTPETTRRLQQAIADAGSADDARRLGSSISVATPGRLLPLAVTTTPIRSEQFAAPMGGPSVMVCVTDLEAEVSVPEHRLRQVFGLTAAEARVALALFDDRSPREAAQELGLSFYTVRAHLVSIFRKTGARRQGELIRLMMRLASDTAH